MKSTILPAIQTKIIDDVTGANAKNTYILAKNDPLPQCIELGFNVVFKGSTPIGNHRSIGRAFKVLIGIYSKITVEGPEELQVSGAEKGLTKHLDDVKSNLANFAFGETLDYRPLYEVDETQVQKKAWKGDIFVAVTSITFGGEYYEVL